jgi:uracil-DNA glycosylase family 4
MKRISVLQKNARAIRQCSLCPGMNIPLVTQAAPGYGDPESPVVIVGQSLCGPCMASQVPFTGGCGRLIDSSLSLAGLEKHQVFVTNVVHCHPPENRRSLPQEIRNCSQFLRTELSAVEPSVIIGLGKDASSWLLNWAAPELLLWSESASKEKARAKLYLTLHPSYVLRQPETARRTYVLQLAKVFAWAFR